MKKRTSFLLVVLVGVLAGLLWRAAPPPGEHAKPGQGGPAMGTDPGRQGISDFPAGHQPKWDTARQESSNTTPWISDRTDLKRTSSFTSGSVLSGRTIDVDGNRLAGVELNLLGESGVEVDSGRVEDSTVSDGDGNFLLELPDSFGGWLRGSAEGYAPSRLRIWSVGPSNLRRIIVLTPVATPLEVSVVEALSGEPAVGANVTATVRNASLGAEQTELGCTTDRFGECVIRDIPAGIRLSVMASLKGHFEDVQELNTAGSTEAVRLRIVKSTGLSLQVVDSNQEPIPAARIGRPDGLFTTADEWGEASLPVIAELSEVPVSVSAAGHSTVEEKLDNSTELQTIVLPPAPVLSGAVVDSQGFSIPGVHLQVRSDAYGVLDETITDRSGQFLLPVQDTISFFLEARREGFFDWSEEFDSERSVPGEIEIQLTPYSAIISGQVLNPAGVPVLSGVVTLTLDGGVDRSMGQQRQSIRDGTYQFGVLEPGRYSLHAASTLYESGDLLHYRSEPESVQLVDGVRKQVDIFVGLAPPTRVRSPGN